MLLSEATGHSEAVENGYMSPVYTLYSGTLVIPTSENARFTVQSVMCNVLLLFVSDCFILWPLPL